MSSKYSSSNTFKTSEVCWEEEKKAREAQASFNNNKKPPSVFFKIY